jgi:hypothetical protein
VGPRNGKSPKKVVLDEQDTFSEHRFETEARMHGRPNRTEHVMADPKVSAPVDSSQLSPLDAQFHELQEYLSRKRMAPAIMRKLPSGAALISVPDVPVPDGWNRTTATITFLAPCGYPFASPAHFWVEPGRFRRANGAFGVFSHDNRPMPEDVPDRSATWFMVRPQSWWPSRDTLFTFFRVAVERLHREPAPSERD